MVEEDGHNTSPGADENDVAPRGGARRRLALQLLGAVRVRRPLLFELEEVIGTDESARYSSVPSSPSHRELACPVDSLCTSWTRVRPVRLFALTDERRVTTRRGVGTFVLTLRFAPCAGLIFSLRRHAPRSGVSRS